jgi:hypothetical protein
VTAPEWAERQSVQRSEMEFAQSERRGRDLGLMKMADKLKFWYKFGLNLSEELTRVGLTQDGEKKTYLIKILISWNRPHLGPHCAGGAGPTKNFPIERASF